VVAVAVALVACAAPATAPGESGGDGAAPAVSEDVALPPAGAAFDYQLGGAYDPRAQGRPDLAEVTVVERDRTAEPAGLGYDICYVNGFQTQPGESADWAADADLRALLVQRDGEPIVDENWPDEFIFDTREPNRAALAEIVGGWIEGCAADGFDAVEIDNLDSYLRSDERMTFDDNRALAGEYVRAAHDAGLAIAQKNTAEHTAELRDVGFDFAVTESCWRWEECASYTDVYETVYDIEYLSEDGLGEGQEGMDRFAEACASDDRPATFILRDLDLVTPDAPGYHYARCD